jgi:hypothetical protein
MFLPLVTGRQLADFFLQEHHVHSGWFSLTHEAATISLSFETTFSDGADVAGIPRYFKSQIKQTRIPTSIQLPPL